MAFDRGNSPARQNSFGFGDRDRTESQSAVAPGNFSEAELIAMIPSLFASVGDYNPYAGIGSRETPADTCEEMALIASALEKRGFTLRSGFAGGADTAFELGTVREDLREIFAPWPGFGANPNSKWDQPRWDMIRAHEAKTDQKFTPAKAHILKSAHLAKARDLAARTEERRVGKEWASECKTRWREEHK